VANANGRLRQDSKVSLGPWPGREIIVEAAGAYPRMRMFLVPKRLYILAVTGNEARIESSDSDGFFGSFRVED
jgi:hypothetical protein